MSCREGRYLDTRHGFDKRVRDPIFELRCPNSDCLSADQHDSPIPDDLLQPRDDALGFGDLQRRQLGLTLLLLSHVCGSGIVVQDRAPSRG